eukprot:TRINITY_DN593_c0_g1_i2.p1 TRINITY_DN593_c0_g1~~TRINITY_DN593_c0_g1_i2.p1  ORF type:complete len:342 (-),score=59.73 TRINITY_DN593_c0_g1_i2:32-1057(-)
MIFHNPVTNQNYSAGTYEVLSIGQLRSDVGELPHSDSHINLNVITRNDMASIRSVDVAHLQAIHKNAVFQVASNFNGIESISERSTPDGKNYVTDYTQDRTQGPAASISAGASAIARVLAAFYNPQTHKSEWSQTAQRQVEFLENIKHFPTVNGYVTLGKCDPNLDFPTDPAELDDILQNIKVGCVKNAQVTSGHRRGSTLDRVCDPNQVVDQVFCAALNIGQGYSGSVNSRSPSCEEKCKLILDAAYEGTYLTAIKNQRESIYLTLIGGGVFGNSLDWISETILKTHLKYGKQNTTLKNVTLVCFDSSQVDEWLLQSARKQGIPTNLICYTDNEPNDIQF